MLPMTKAEKSLDFPSGARFAVIAGGGALPADVANALSANGFSPFIFRVDGEVTADFSQQAGTAITLEDLAGLFSHLKQQSITHLVMAGSISRRPDWRAVKLSPGLVPVVLRVIRALASGDDTLLGTVIRLLEKRGVTVVGVQHILPEFVAAMGYLGKTQAGKTEHATAITAFAAARAIGALDAGQAAIAIGKRVVALEGAEGTAAMLARIEALKAQGRLKAGRGGVLAKCRKPGQDERADLPTIGPDTIQAAAGAGLAGIIIEAGGTLILDAKQTVQAADQNGIFILGWREDAS